MVAGQLQNGLYGRIPTALDPVQPLARRVSWIEGEAASQAPLETMTMEVSSMAGRRASGFGNRKSGDEVGWEILSQDPG